MKTEQLTNTEKFLQLFTEVKPGEGTTILLMFTNIFLILCAYYFIKPLREGWVAISDIDGLSKMEVKAYSSFIQSILLLFFISWYGRLVKRFDRVTLISRTTLFCISNLLIFWLLQSDFFNQRLPVSGIIFYLWVGMFGVFVVAQFWTFSADIYNAESGKRLLPLIAIGGTSGAATGSWIVNYLLSSNIISTDYLLLIATIPLFISIFLIRIVDQRLKKNHLPITEKKSVDSATELDYNTILNGAKLVFYSRLILFVALVTLLTNWVNTNGENLLFQVIQDTLTNQALEQGITNSDQIREFTRDGTTAFYGDFFFSVNIIALLLQAFVTSRLLKFGGISSILMLLPIIALISYSVMALLPILVIVKCMKIAENATDYSINNTARHVLWLPVNSQMKFLGKPAIDTFYVRLGDGLAAITVLIGVQLLNLSIQHFFLFNIFLVILWLICGVTLVHEFNKISKKPLDT
jgi:AAA family ATP:ADP antiporter